MILATSTVSIVLYVLLAIFSRKTASTVSEPGVFTAKGVVAHSVAGNNGKVLCQAYPSGLC